MEAYLRKYFWTLNILVVVLCAVFAARACNNVVAAAYLSGSDAPAPTSASQSRAAAAKARARQKSAATEPATKSSTAMIARNMFCSACEPIVPEAPEDSGPVDPNHVPPTTLPLTLLATNISSQGSYSFATIRNSQSDKQGAYWTGDTIPGAGEVVAISARYVDFKNAQSKRLERISLLKGEAPVRTVARTAPKPKTRTSPANQAEAELDAGIKKVGENSYEISRDLVEKVRGNIAMYARGARIVPHIENGKATGYKVYAIRPSSVFAKIGVRNGDIINGVNGLNIASPREALEVYTKLTDASNLSLSLMRRGDPVTLKYRIR
ncbi:MAG TPA: type II secretion system protein GspC [Kofleriaceae bacterium]|nr:type II secretion system protein GspC [Kofleriaceae bacterium]